MDKKISRWTLIGGISILALGVIHTLAGLVLMPQMVKPLEPDNAAVMFFMFEMVGIAMIFTGLLILYCRRALATVNPGQSCLYWVLVCLFSSWEAVRSSS